MFDVFKFFVKVLFLYTVSLLTTGDTYVYKNIRLYFYFGDICVEQKSNRREFTHTKELSGDRRASEQLTLAEIRELTVYNSDVTYSNSTFSLTMVTTTSHFFVFHWLCCLIPIGYLPKPGSVGVCICHYHRIQPRPQFRWYSDIFGQVHLFSISTVFTAPVGMVTFRQSPCWYYASAGAALSTSSDTQHLWTWWYFGDHTSLIYLSTTSAVFTPASHVDILHCELHFLSALR